MRKPMVEVYVTKADKFYFAHLGDNHHTCGKTPDEALGKLIRCRPFSFGIRVWERVGKKGHLKRISGGAWHEEEDSNNKA